MNASCCFLGFHEFMKRWKTSPFAWSIFGFCLIVCKIPFLFATRWQEQGFNSWDASTHIVLSFPYCWSHKLVAPSLNGWEDGVSFFDTFVGEFFCTNDIQNFDSYILVTIVNVVFLLRSYFLLSTYRLPPTVMYVHIRFSCSFDVLRLSEWFNKHNWAKSGSVQLSGVCQAS